MEPMASKYEVHLPEPHDRQQNFIYSKAKRKVIRAGRRGGKTVGVAILAVLAFLAGKRVLYAAPTIEQVGRFWATVSAALYDPTKAGIFHKNESEHFIELMNSEQRIKAKTSWNADSLRGDYCALLILDEWQLMDEDAWELVGAPMLLDNNGDAAFVYTPPSLHSRSVSKAKDPQHAAKMYAKAQADKTGRWEAFHFTSMANPHINTQALAEIAQDMTSVAYRMEILAEDVNEAPGALWLRQAIEDNRVVSFPTLERIVVAIDPSATSTGDEAGIIVAGKVGDQGYVLADRSLQGSPLTWAKAAVSAYHMFGANELIAESNNGGEMVELTIKQVDENVSIKLVHASRGKQTRAEPIAAKAENGNIHHVGKFEALEDELCLWIPGDPSPNRLDAMVWAFTDLMTGQRAWEVPYQVDKSFIPQGDRRDLSKFAMQRKPKEIWDRDW